MVVGFNVVVGVDSAVVVGVVTVFVEFVLTWTTHELGSDFSSGFTGL